MTLRDILTEAMKIVGEEINLDGNDIKRNRFVEAADMIYSELIEQHVHLKYEEKVPVTDGRIYYSEFTKPVKDVIKIYQNGKKVPYTLYSLYIACTAKGEVTVTYVYHGTAAKTIDDVLDIPPAYTAATLALGAAGEYYYRNGLYEEGLFYTNRYENAIRNVSRRRNPIITETRRFL